jgi:hypothetical protein
MSFGGRGGAPQQGGGGYDDMAQLASINMMMGIMKSCFSDCITNFSSSDLSSSEKTCLQNCSKRMASSYEVVAQAQQTLASRGMGAF